MVFKMTLIAEPDSGCKSICFANFPGISISVNTIVDNRSIDKIQSDKHKDQQQITEKVKINVIRNVTFRIFVMTNDEAFIERIWKNH